METKKGITMTSIIIYVILFFIFTLTVTVISNNFNRKLFVDRGYAIDINSFNKLEYNLLDSSNNSNSVSLLGDQIYFSNGDTYLYDDTSKVVTKNGGILISNISSYSQTVENKEDGDLLTINIKFHKYLHQDLEDRVIKVFVERT